MHVVDAWMDGMALDQLVAFDQVVRDGSFSRAALSLGLGQPAVSSRIQGLEAALGGLVFRRGRRIALTPLGENFLPYARRTMEVLSDGVENVRLTLAGKRGRASLGALASLAGALVGPALGRLMRQHPEVDCLVRSGWHEADAGSAAGRAGRAGAGDLALPARAGTRAAAAVQRCASRWCWCAHRRHPLARLARVRRGRCRAAGAAVLPPALVAGAPPGDRSPGRAHRSEPRAADGERAASWSTPGRAWGSSRGR
jgi:DNA-binding transcriptional LysR family regulator